MQPFPEEDEFELRQRHSRRAVDLEIFRRLSIEVEGMLPGGMVKRRDGTCHRFPFGDRKAALGQPCDSSDDDHQKDQRGHSQKPVRNGEWALRRCRTGFRCGMREGRVHWVPPYGL